MSNRLWLKTRRGTSPNIFLIFPQTTNKVVLVVVIHSFSYYLLKDIYLVIELNTILPLSSQQNIFISLHIVSSWENGFIRLQAKFLRTFGVNVSSGCVLGIFKRASLLEFKRQYSPRRRGASRSWGPIDGVSGRRWFLWRVGRGGGGREKSSCQKEEDRKEIHDSGCDNI